MVTMSDLIDRQDAIEALYKKCVTEGLLDEFDTEDTLRKLPSAEPEMITIEEVSNQLGGATIQSALYWFEFLKTLDLLGFAIIRKGTK